MLDQRKKTDYISWTILIGILLLAIEISFFNKGIIFSIILSTGFIYIGRKKWNRKAGKVLFWIGVIHLLFNIFSMMTIRFFLIAILLYVIIQFFQSKRNPSIVRPEVRDSDSPAAQGEVLEQKPLFCNLLFGKQKTPEHAYEWNDINIQTGIGDAIIDLSYTVLPKGEAVVFVRGWIGNVQILVPYEIEVSLAHSAVVGAAHVFEREKEQIFNQTLIYQTPSYENAEQKLKIITSMIIGNLEVKRI
ncbi:cell wall-active antibiotics response protein LiaF [Anoxybacteroides tepidamans]|uniref:cell wall-active antibiotics response protein LiaF n=1 Tax=Anoxybacteroides tepidamans TaxID=265948 RepID=UPI000480AA9D|nr:cell wall-active antibiotics response protein LiaF [Anoxybacillus tepidamans]